MRELECVACPHGPRNINASLTQPGPPTWANQLMQLDLGRAEVEQLGTSTARSLGVDAATGGFRQSEYNTALRVQAARRVRLTRSSKPELDWIDQQGAGPTTPWVASTLGFSTSNGLSSRGGPWIIDKVDFVPVDSSGFSPAQASKVQDFVDRLGSQVFTVE